MKSFITWAGDGLAWTASLAALANPLMDGTIETDDAPGKDD